MTRNIKALGLALLVVLAASAIAANAASAQNGKLTSDGPATLTGTQTGAAAENTLSAFGGETQCPNAIYTGHEYNTTPHEPIPSGAETITVSPHYGLCTALGVPATVDMNGCDYVLHLEETTGTDKYGVKSTVQCPVGLHVTITMFTSVKKHSEGTSFCHITITEKAEGYSGLSVTDTTNGKVDISGTITGISADKKSPTGSILCPEETTTTASLKQDITVEGKNALGEATGIGISHS